MDEFIFLLLFISTSAVVRTEAELLLKISATLLFQYFFFITSLKKKNQSFKKQEIIWGSSSREKLSF